MDKLSRFRRRPRPPAIETALDSPTSESFDTHMADADTESPPPSQTLPTLRRSRPQLLQQHSLPPQSVTDEPKMPAAKVPRIGHFGILKRHMQHPRRTRDVRPSTAPAPTPSSNALASPLPDLPSGIHSGSSPQLPVLQRDSSSLSSTLKSSTTAKPQDGIHGEKRPKPSLPWFLSLSEQDMDSKYHDLVFAERMRVDEGMRGQNVPGCKWATFVQPDIPSKGQMDRYSNIKPWAHNRVKLHVPDGGLNYVNASTMKLKSRSKSRQPLRYIAMQGPTEPSVGYVWRMIAEQTTSPAVIVQLTGMYENGAVKCFQYFPLAGSWTLNEGNVWGDDWSAELTLESTESILDGAIEKRKFLLHVRGEDADEPRIVWHFWYHKWSDFGVPLASDFESFYQLMELSAQHSHPASPRVIHCSAGVGRTGTFMAVQHLLCELRAGDLATAQDESGRDLVYDTVDSLRAQRRGMVQGETQYKFIYSVIRRLWQTMYGGENDDDGGEPASKRLDGGSGHADPFTDGGRRQDGVEEEKEGVSSETR